MKPAIIYMLEVLVCSGVLLAAYAILLERRVKFRWCRLYLLLTTFAAALIPLLRIPVWPGRVVAAAPAIPPDLPVWMGEVLPDEGGSFAVTPEIFCLGLYLLGAVLIAGVMAWQVFRIHRLRRGAEISRTGDYTLVRTRRKSLRSPSCAPFTSGTKRLPGSWPPFWPTSRATSPTATPSNAS